MRALPYNRDNCFMATVPSKKGPDAPPEDAAKQIFVKNLPRTWTHEDLYAAFLPCGEIASAKVSINANFESRRYGFIQFKKLDSAVRAVADMHGKEVQAALPDGAEESATLTVSKFENKRQRQGKEDVRCSANLYVKNFPALAAEQDASGSEGEGEAPREFDDSDLVGLFRPFGEIQSARVMRDAEGKPRGFGFVCFADARDAKKALEHFTKLAEELQGGLYVCEAKSKE